MEWKPGVLGCFDLTFSEVVLESGAYDVSVSLLNVNGEADDNAANDAIETSFVINALGNAVTLEVEAEAGMQKLRGCSSLKTIPLRREVLVRLTCAFLRDASYSK